MSDSASAEEHGCINIIEPCLWKCPFICVSGTSDRCEGEPSEPVLEFSHLSKCSFNLATPLVEFHIIMLL